jgi:hypothetical protein
MSLTTREGLRDVVTLLADAEEAVEEVALSLSSVTTTQGPQEVDYADVGALTLFVRDAKTVSTALSERLEAIDAALGQLGEIVLSGEMHSKSLFDLSGVTA